MLLWILIVSSLCFYRCQDTLYENDYIDEERPEGEYSEISNSNSSDYVIVAPKKSILNVISVYRIEVFFILICILTLSIYAIGVSLNLKVMKYITNEFKNWAKKEYLVIDSNDRKLGLFSDENKAECCVWATASQYNKGMFFRINVFPRQSIAQWGIFLATSKKMEIINLTVYLDAKVDIRITVVGRSSYLRSDKHLYSLTKISKDCSDVCPLPNGLLSFCENKKFATSALQSFQDILKLYHDALNYLFISDATYDSLQNTLKIENEHTLPKTADEKNLQLGSARIELSINCKDFFPTKEASKYSISVLCEEFSKSVKSLCSRHKKTASNKEKLSEFRLAEVARTNKEIHEKYKEDSMLRKDQKIRKENELLLKSTDKHDILKLEKNKARREQRNQKKNQRVVMHTVR